MNKPQYKAQDFIDAMPGSGGVITTIARRVGCAWDTAKKYITDYATVKRAYDNECESILDLAESKLFQAVSEGDLSAVKYALSTKGQKRGWYTKQAHEFMGEGGGPVETIVRVIYEDTLGGGNDGDGNEND